MELQNLKRWQWAIVGLLIGLALSYAFSDHDVATDAGWRDKEIKQPTFERDAFSRSRESHEPLLQNVVVEPPVLDYMNHAKQIVRGDRLRYSDKYKREFRDSFFYYADSPYVPLVTPSTVDPAAMKTVKTVMDFLAVAKNTISPTTMPAQPQPWQAGISFQYRFGWEYQPNWNLALWMAGGLIVVGGIWPTFLNLLVGAGFGKAIEPKLSADEAYLARFGSEKPSPVKTAVRDHTAADRRLTELNATLEAGLKPAEKGVDSGKPDGSTTLQAVPAIRKLETEPTSAAVAPIADAELSEEERRKRFAAGDFYPVARGPAKKPKKD